MKSEEYEVAVIEQLINDIYSDFVEEGVTQYKNILENTPITSVKIDYWKETLKLYQSLDSSDKEVMLRLIKQTIIDTSSRFCGLLDGSYSLEHSYDISLMVDEHPSEGILQDIFLDIVEEKNNDII